MKNISIKIFPFLVFFLLFFPYLSHAQFVYECPPGVGGRAGECTFDDLIRAVINITNRGTQLALGLSVAVIAYAGFTYMTSGGSAAERSKANEMLRKVAIGIVVIIAAWVIVRLITTALLRPGIDTFLG